MNFVKDSPENISIDSLMQEIQSLKLKNSSLANTIEHLTDDNDLLLKDREVAENKLQEERIEHINKTGKLKTELCELRECFDKYKEDSEKEKLLIDNPVVNKSQPAAKEEVNDSFIIQLDEYKLEIENLNEQLELYRKKDMENNQRIKKIMEEKNLVEHQLDETSTLLASKTQLLQELSTSYEELKEEKLLLSSELAALKSAPSDSTNRGNSLFGEVEDRRQAMSSKLRILYNKYIALKKNFVRKNADFDRLKAELSLLQTRWNNYVESQPKADERLIAAQDSRIKDLMERNAELEKRPEEPQFVTVDEHNLSWALGFIERARREATNLRHELDRYSLNQYAVEQALSAKTGEAIKLNEENLRLKTEIVKFQLANEIEKETDSTATIMNEDNKGNQENLERIQPSIKKRVQFND